MAETTATLDSPAVVEPRTPIAAPLFAPGEPAVLNDDQQRCVTVLASISALYNLQVPGGSISDAVLFRPSGLSILLASELATFDAHQLTNLVVAAHAYCVRAAISPWRPHLDEDRDSKIRRNILASYQEFDADDEPIYDDGDVTIEAIELTLHARDPHGTTNYDRHPTLDELAAAGERPAPR